MNIWPDILGKTIIGPLIIEKNLSGELYLNLIDEIIDPLLTNIFEKQMDAAGNLIF